MNTAMKDMSTIMKNMNTYIKYSPKLAEKKFIFRKVIKYNLHKFL